MRLASQSHRRIPAAAQGILCGQLRGPATARGQRTARGRDISVKSMRARRVRSPVDPSCRQPADVTCSVAAGDVRVDEFKDALEAAKIASLDTDFVREAQEVVLSTAPALAHSDRHAPFCYAAPPMNRPHPTQQASRYLGVSATLRSQRSVARRDTTSAPSRPAAWDARAACMASDQQACHGTHDGRFACCRYSTSFSPPGAPSRSASLGNTRPTMRPTMRTDRRASACSLRLRAPTRRSRGLRMKSGGALPPGVSSRNVRARTKPDLWQPLAMWWCDTKQAPGGCWYGPPCDVAAVRRASSV